MHFSFSQLIKSLGRYEFLILKENSPKTFFELSAVFNNNVKKASLHPFLKVLPFD